MLDHVIYLDSKPQILSFSSLIFDYALVLRPETLIHKLGTCKIVFAVYQN